MKKTAVYLLLCIALAFSGCARPTDSEKTPDADGWNRVQGKFGVDTNYSGLTSYNTDWEVKSYYFDEPLSEFVPDDGYGAILPYVGEVLYDADGEVVRYKYGLCTAKGEIITKPAYSEVTELCYYPDYSDYINGVFIGMISIGKMTENGNSMYAVVASDGSWITDFIYSYVYCTDGYAIAGLTNGDKEYAIIATDGSEVYPDADWLLSFSEGYALVWSGEDSMYYFMNMLGERVFGPFEDATNFSEGTAAVKDESGWRYIDDSGNTVLNIGSEYLYCGVFTNGYAPLRDEEGGAVIDRDGNVIFDKELFYMGNGIWYDFSSYPGCYYDGDDGFTQITYNGSDDVQYTSLDRYFYKNDSGGTILFKAGDDKGVYIEGNEMSLHKLNDDTLNVYRYSNDTSYYGIIDLAGNFLLPPTEDAYLVKMENDGTINFVSGNELKKSDGTVIMKDCVSAASFEGTDYFQVQDKYSSGYITTDGEWILRVSLLDSLPD